ncbi:hypothetical protein ACFYPA_29030 [Streptomyces sp. NPDC005775]|uniref:hypothetical protein n=1 Tax=Streptomyces sp. NPDC005775 TaxID=3364729 RepID=UPI00368ADA1D
MANEPEKTPIQNKYAQQYAADLAANRTEQDEITTQIMGLQERLGQLKVEERWLGQAQGSLPGTAAPNEPEAAAVEDGLQGGEESSAPAATDAPTTVPQPRQDQSVKVEEPKRPAKKAAPAKKTTVKKAGSVKNATKKPAVKKAAAKRPVAAQTPAPEAATTSEAPAEKAAEKKSGPPLRQLILDILLKTPGEPCVAREVSDQLAKDHPSRATTVQSVRNNLESLVKMNLAEKSRQQGNAMYTAPAERAAVTAADDTADGEDEQARETAAEKVPAQV